MDLEFIILSEVSQRQISHDITYMWNLKKMIQMNLFTKQKQTHIHRKQTYRDFPRGTVVKNPPANAGNMGSSPRLGRSHMPWSN